MDIIEAIKTKLRFVDKKTEAAWRSDWGALYEQIQPQNPRTVSVAIKAFPQITFALIQLKATMMMITLLEALDRSKVNIREDELGELRHLILGYFEEDSYLKRFSSFIGSVERKFSRSGLTFRPAVRKIDLTQTTFVVGVKNNLRDMRSIINADFDIICLNTNTNNKFSGLNILSSLSDWIELKPNIFGIGVNINAFFEKLLTRLGKNNITKI